jgi:hypothetical protein
MALLNKTEELQPTDRNGTVCTFLLISILRLKAEERDEACSMYGGDDKVNKTLLRNPEVNTQLHQTWT